MVHGTSNSFPWLLSLGISRDIKEKRTFYGGDVEGRRAEAFAFPAWERKQESRFRGP